MTGIPPAHRRPEPSPQLPPNQGLPAGTSRLDTRTAMLRLIPRRPKQPAKRGVHPVPTTHPNTKTESPHRTRDELQSKDIPKRRNNGAQRSRKCFEIQIRYIVYHSRAVPSHPIPSPSLKIPIHTPRPPEAEPEPEPEPRPSQGPPSEPGSKKPESTPPHSTTPSPNRTPTPFLIGRKHSTARPLTPPPDDSSSRTVKEKGREQKRERKEKHTSRKLQVSFLYR